MAKRPSQSPPAHVTPGMSKKNNPRLFIIDDETINDPAVRDAIFVPTVGGQPKGHGYKPRDYTKHPPQMFAALPSEMKLVPEPEVADRIKQQDELKHNLGYLVDWEATDQNGNGYCWAYSTGGAIMAARQLMGLPYVRLNPHGVAAIIKGGRDEGGWCGLSAKFAREVGYTPASHWPGHSRSLSNDTPALRAECAKYKSTEDWVDLTRSVYDQNLTLRQLYSCLLSNLPCAVDFNWWSHSVFGMRLVIVEAGSIGLEIFNSWTPQWGDRGRAVLRGSKAIPDGAICLRSIAA